MFPARARPAACTKRLIRDLIGFSFTSIFGGRPGVERRVRARRAGTRVDGRAAQRGGHVRAGEPVPAVLVEPLIILVARPDRPPSCVALRGDVRVSHAGGRALGAR
jgi:hypothetical protein